MILDEATTRQKILSNEQVEAFYHDEFVEDQVRHFVSLVGATTGKSRTVIDVGGGCGFFAKRLAHCTGRTVRVLDLDPASIEACRRSGIEASRGDALKPEMLGDEEIVSFNLILHHLVGSSERVTLELQRKALALWRPHVRAVFVNEYIYESYFRNLSGWLIFQITRSGVLSAIGRIAAVIAPSLKANTFGVGVRFRAHGEWLQVFAQAGYDVQSRVVGDNEPVSLPRRLLLIRHIRRDSFLLVPKAS